MSYFLLYMYFLGAYVDTVNCRWPTQIVYLDFFTFNCACFLTGELHQPDQALQSSHWPIASPLCLYMFNAVMLSVPLTKVGQTKTLL